MKDSIPLFALAAVTMLTLAATAAAHGGTVTLTGEGIVHFSPDAVRLVLNTQTRGATAEAARTAASARIAAWEESAGQLLGQLQDYDDSQLTVNEATEYDENGRPTDKRYFQASQVVRFNLTDLDQLNRVISAAEAADLSYHLNENSYYPTQRKALEDTALAAAIDDAQARCDFIAKRLQAQCGDVETLQVNDQGEYPRPMMMSRTTSQESVSHISDRELKARVQVTFQLD